MSGGDFVMNVMSTYSNTFYSQYRYNGVITFSYWWLSNNLLTYLVQLILKGCKLLSEMGILNIDYIL